MPIFSFFSDWRLLASSGRVRLASMLVPRVDYVLDPLKEFLIMINLICVLNWWRNSLPEEGLVGAKHIR